MTAPESEDSREEPDSSADRTGSDSVCPVCGETLQQESCKVVCRSDTCVYRIVFNCSEF
jgi:hypothetical protein